jgi:micrococcal nuclease
LTRWTTAGLRLGCAGVLLLLCASLATANFTGPVVSVLDGDTIEVLHNTHPERVRLSGIDCPEKGQAFGNNAKHAASRLVFGKEVTLHTHGLDKYGRTLGDVFLRDGMNVNQELVKQGWCWWYRKYAPGDTGLEGLEKEARGNKRGLWADPTPVPPWVYRKARRGQSLDLSDLVPLDAGTEGSFFACGA